MQWKSMYRQLYIKRNCAKATGYIPTNLLIVALGEMTISGLHRSDCRLEATDGFDALMNAFEPILEKPKESVYFTMKYTI